MNIEEFYTSIRKDADPEHLGDGASYHTAHYLKAFERKDLFYWNWAAFLMGPFWMLYRGLYAPYVMLMAISVVLSYLSEPLILNLLVCIALGIYGDAMYIFFVQKAHDRGQRMPPGELSMFMLIGIHVLVVFVLASLI